MAGVSKTVVVDGREIKFAASALTPIVYKRLFKRDYFKDLIALTSLGEKVDAGGFDLTTDDYTVFMMIAYCMAYQGCGAGVDTVKQAEFTAEYPDMWSWLDSFQTFPLIEVLPQIIELWASNGQAQVQAKNVKPIPALANRQ